MSESCNLNANSQTAITSQPQAHQNQLNNSISYSDNKQQSHLNYTAPHPTSSNVTGAQLTNLTSSQLNKKSIGQSQTQLKSNQKSSAINSQTSGYRKVFIQRDYTEGTSVRFQNKFPEELEGYIERQHFDYLITTLNCYYDKAEAANLSTFCEGFCACLTAYLIYICMESHYEKYMRKTRDYINEQNDKVWKPRGLYVTDPIDRGLRILEITIGPRAQKRNMISDQFKRE